MRAHGALPWLPRPPQDFRDQCERVLACKSARGDILRRLAAHDLDTNQLDRLARCVTDSRGNGLVQPLDHAKVGLISNATTDLLITGLIGTGARHGLALEVSAAPFGMTLQAALDPNAAILRDGTDIILLALDCRAFFPDFIQEGDAEALLSAAQNELTALVTALRAATAATIIVQTLATPPERVFGSLDRRQPGTLVRLIERFNVWLSDDVPAAGIVMLDVASLAEAVGSAHWFDPKFWNLARLPFAPQLAPYYCDHAARLIAAIRGKGRKVLVLDLDNTLWGGVIGDDGLDGVRLSAGDPAGESFLALQRAALALRSRGVVLALCSKNDEAVALSAIRDHPEMLLREADFSAYQINWSDKASNLETLATRLGLGLDSFVFLDDSPFEREQVRSALPSVFVLELPSDPSQYARLLMSSGAFETVTFSQEDRERADLYAANSKRETLLVRSRDLETYLRSLEMRALFVAGGNIGWQRFTQLINKSNQFNLTTRRYSEPEILSLTEDLNTLTLQVRLIDRFGDNGIISCVICRPDGRDWVVDCWVMSCRVLGRNVEEAVLNEIVRRARTSDVLNIRGVYKPTNRNGMVQDHYRKLGFEKTGEDLGSVFWILPVETYVPRMTAIDVKFDH